MSEIINLSDKPSIFGNILAELRDAEIQKDAYRFRENVEQAGYLMAYEISKKLGHKDRDIITPLAKTSVKVIDEDLALVCILRASIPMFNGFQKVFRTAESAFLGAMRKEDGDVLEAIVSYKAMPDLTDKTLVFIDPMLATGQSMIQCYQSLTMVSKPKKSIIACLFATEQGISTVVEGMKPDFIYTAVIDSELNAKSYIVPGLGDAGDLAFGKKINS